MTKILLIEDEIEIRTNLQELLELENYTIMTAENGLIGLHLAYEEMPDLILCDIMMPELDGYEVLKQLREQPTTAKIPVLFLTAKTERKDLRKGMAMGADDYITKPFTSDEVLAAINLRLQRQTELIEIYTEKQQQIAKQLLEEVYQSQNTLEKNSEQAKQRADILHNILEQLSNNFRAPLANIHLAIRLLKQASSDLERNRYLSILENECAREIEILNKLDHLQTLLTPENTRLLQDFNLLKKRTNQKDQL